MTNEKDIVRILRKVVAQLFRIANSLEHIEEWLTIDEESDDQDNKDLLN